jgi:hypothetical protein
MKTAKIVLGPIKDSDGWRKLLFALGHINVDDRGEDEASEVSQALIKKYFEFCEYASIEIEVDETLRIVGGRILPFR